MTHGPIPNSCYSFKRSIIFNLFLLDNFSLYRHHSKKQQDNFGIYTNPFQNISSRDKPSVQAEDLLHNISQLDMELVYAFLCSGNGYLEDNSLSGPGHSKILFHNIGNQSTLRLDINHRHKILDLLAFRSPFQLGMVNIQSFIRLLLHMNLTMT